MRTSDLTGTAPFEVVSFVLELSTGPALFAIAIRNLRLVALQQARFHPSTLRLLRACQGCPQLEGTRSHRGEARQRSR